MSAALTPFAFVHSLTFITAIHMLLDRHGGMTWNIWAALHRRPVGLTADEGTRNLIDPTSEETWATVTSGGGAADVDHAVAAAKRAFKTFSKSSIDERVALIDRIIAAYERRAVDLGQLIAQEVGVPVSMKAQVAGPLGHMKVARDLVRTYAFERQLADTIIRRRTHRRLRLDLAMELADPDFGHQGHLRHRRRLHDGAEALGRLTGLGSCPGRGHG